MRAPAVGGDETCDGAWKMRGGRRRSLKTSQRSVITLLVISFIIVFTVNRLPLLGGARLAAARG